MVKHSAKRKYGFSMLEAAVTMLMVAVFTAAATNVFTRKHQKVAHTTSHGSFECYYNEAGQICQRMSQEGIYQEPSCELPECTFKPLKASEYYVVNAIGGGGGGNTAGLGGSAGEYRTFFIPSISKELRIIPGKGGTAGSTPADGEATVIENTDGESLLIAYGGKGGYVNESTYKSTIKAEDIYACSLYFGDGSTALESCASRDKTPYCQINTQSVYAEYCVDRDTISLPSSSYLYFDTDNQLYAQNSYMRNRNVKMYLYVRDEVLNFNTTRNEAPSKLDEYLDAAELDDANVWRMGIGGSGSPNAQDGTPGAVLIVW